MNKLTPQEEQLMQAIWQTDGGVVRDFLNVLDSKENIPYTTAASIVKNLEKKNYVKAKKLGNSNYYSPIVSMEHYRKTSFKEIFQNYFKGSYRDLVASFVKEGDIDSKELKEIIDLIEKDSEK